MATFSAFGEEASQFLNLPPEMIAYIFNFLTLPEKKPARCVCRRWVDLLDAPHHRNYEFYPIIGPNCNVDDSLKFLWNTRQEIEHLRLTGVSKNFPAVTATRNKFPVIRNALLGKENSGENVSKFLKYGCEFLKSLSLTYCSFSKVNLFAMSKVVPAIQWAQLGRLEIHQFTGWRPNPDIKSARTHLIAIGRFLSLAKIPHLTKLCFTTAAQVSEKLSPHVIAVFPELYVFIGHHARTLTSLEILVKNLPPNIPELVVSNEAQDSIRQYLKLDHFEFLSQENEQCNGVVKLALPCLLESQTETLKKFIFIVFCRYLAENTADHVNVEEIILRNQNTLKEVDVCYSTINLTCLTECKSLEKLTVGPFIQSTFNEPDPLVPIPTLTYLELFVSTDFPHSFEAWIIRNFENVKIIKLHFAGMAYRYYNLAAALEELVISSSAHEIYVFGMRKYQVQDFCTRFPDLVKITTNNHPFYRAEQLGALIKKGGQLYFQLCYPNLHTPGDLPEYLYGLEGYG